MSVPKRQMPPVHVAKPNLLDRAIGVISPARALERLRARSGLEALYGSWTGGRTDRRETGSWFPFGGSADADVNTDLPILRARSRDAARNQPLALGAINTVVTNVVGTGLVVRPVIDREVLGMDADAAREWQNTTGRLWRTWAERAQNCDAAKTLDFYGLQELAFRAALESGDVFATLPWIKSTFSAFDLKVNLIEADRCSNPNNGTDTLTQSAGITLDDMGAPTQYSFLTSHPGGFYQPGNRKWVTVPAFGAKSGRRNVVHLFTKLRPGQTRGVPYLAPVIEALKQLSDYSTSEMQAAVVSSLFTVFVKTETGQGLDPGYVAQPSPAPSDALSPNPSFTDDVSPSQPRSGNTMALGRGAIVDLAEGEDVAFADPKRPNIAFDPFVLACLRQIGVALELPFEVLVKHFTSSYSAARAALLEVWRFYKKRRVWLATMFCQPVYEAWLEEAISKGIVEAPGFFDDPEARAAWCGTKWIGDAPGQIDPQKEVDAAKGRIELMLSTYGDECDAMTGSNWDDLIEQRAMEEDKLKELGLQTTLAPLTPANTTGPTPPQGPGAPAPAKPGPTAPADNAPADEGGDQEDDDADRNEAP